MDLEERMLTFSIVRDCDDDDLRASDVKHGHGVCDRGDAADDDDGSDGGSHHDDGVGVHARPYAADAADGLADCDPLRDHGVVGVRAARSLHVDRAWHVERARRRDAMDGHRALGAAASAAWSATVSSGPSTAIATGVHRSHDDDDDDAFLESYRAGRRAQLVAARATVILPAEGDSDAPRYGSVVQVVDRFKFVEEIDSLPVDVHAVVLMYQPFLTGCACVMGHLMAFADRYPHVACFSVKSDVLSADLDPIALPCLVVYKATRTVHSTLRVHERVCTGRGERLESHVDALLQLMVEVGVLRRGAPPAARRSDRDDD